MGNVWDEALDAAPEVEDEIIEVPEPLEPLDTDQYGLMYVGYLTDDFDVFGHRIAIRTLKIGEELEAELLVQKYKDTQEADRAYTVALVAACVQSVDNKPLVQGLGPAEESLERRYAYLIENWHWVTISAIYNRYRNLVERSMTALEDVKKN